MSGHSKTEHFYNFYFDYNEKLLKYLLILIFPVHTSPPETQFHAKIIYFKQNKTKIKIKDRKTNEKSIKLTNEILFILRFISE